MEKTALVIVTMRYYDIEKDILFNRTQTHEVSLNRCKVLIENKVCELIEIKKNGIR